jgi:hypothetical protein
MTTKLTKRKQSKVLVERYQDAADKLGTISQVDLSAEKSDYLARMERNNSLPDHIKVIRRLGILDAERGHTDGDLAALIDAESLLQRERNHGGDFVTSGSFSAAQKSNRQGEPRGESDDYPSDEIHVKARALGYFELQDGDRRKKTIRFQIVALLRLDVRNKATSPESRDRHIKRILNR